MSQKKLTDWDVVNKQIDKNTNFRFRYKKIIGESLTSFITKQRQLGFTSQEAKTNLLNLENVDKYFNKYPFMKDTFLKNIEISISSRYAEQKSYEKSKVIEE